MAFGDPSAPARYLGGQTHSTNRELALEVFGGEVLEAFDFATLFMGKHEVRTVSGGQRAARFPKTWKATAEYHSPGQEMLGTDIDTTEIVVTVDDILVSHVALSDIDVILSHFDVRGPYAKTMGHALAKVFDKNVARQLVLAARTAADGPFPGGDNVTDAALTATGTIDGQAWIDAIRQVSLKFYNADVPEGMPKYLAVNGNVFDGLKYAKDANGNYLILNRDFGHGLSARGVEAGAPEVIRVEDVLVYRSRNLPSTNETADTSVHSKYRANYATTTGIAWAPMAVATTKIMDIGFETTRDTRRLEDFMVAKMLVGHGTLRPECAIEIKTS